MRNVESQAVVKEFSSKIYPLLFHILDVLHVLALSFCTYVGVIAAPIVGKIQIHIHIFYYINIPVSLSDNNITLGFYPCYTLLHHPGFVLPSCGHKEDLYKDAINILTPSFNRLKDNYIQNKVVFSGFVRLERVVIQASMACRNFR